MIQTSQTSAFEWERLHRSISSDESELDNDTSNALADNMKNLSDTKSGTPSLLEQDEDEFRTAPNSPSQNGDTLLSNTDLYSSRKCDDLMIPDPCYHSRKRRYSDKTKSPEPRKVSRNLAESHLADYSEMNDVSCPRCNGTGVIALTLLSHRTSLQGPSLMGQFKWRGDPAQRTRCMIWVQPGHC